MSSKKELSRTSLVGRMVSEAEAEELIESPAGTGTGEAVAKMRKTPVRRTISMLKFVLGSMVESSVDASNDESTGMGTA